MQVNNLSSQVHYPKLNFETWSEGLNIYTYIWTEQHSDKACLLMHCNQIIRDMAKVLPSSVWLGYDREFRILRQKYPTLPWDTPRPQIYLQQLAKASPFSFRGGDSIFPLRDGGALTILEVQHPKW